MEQIYVRLGLTDAYFKTLKGNKQYYKMFLKKISSKNKFALILFPIFLSVESAFSLFIDVTISNENSVMLWMEGCVLLYCILCLLGKYYFLSFYWYKYMIAGAIFINILSRCVSLFVLHYLGYELPTDCNKGFFLAAGMLEASMVTATGIFHFWEAIGINLLIFLTVLSQNLIFYDNNSVIYIVKWMVQCIFNMIEDYKQYNDEIESFNKLIMIEQKNDELNQFVNRLLPKHMQYSLQDSGKGELYQNVTLLFADIVGFTKFSAGKFSREVVEMLSRLFTSFDKECSRLDLFKLYTIGDCYVVMGFNDKNNRKDPGDEAHDVALLAITMIKLIRKVRETMNIDLNMRIGIHTGSVIGGIIGTNLVRFDLYGYDYIIANQMESNGEAGRICVSETTREMLDELETCHFTFEKNKPVDLGEHMGVIQSFFLNFDNA